MTNLYYFMINYLLFIASVVILHMSVRLSFLTSSFINPIVSLVYLFILGLALFE